MTTSRAYGAAAALTLAICATPQLLPFQVSDARAGVLAPIWTGAYIGFHGGANWSDLDTDLSSTVSSSSFQGGGHVGYNVGLGGVVVGLEGDANYDGSEFGFSTAGGGTGSLGVDWNGSIRGRVGVPIGPALLYATAGYAWTEMTLTEKSAAGASFSASHSFNGVVYGAGIESYVLPNLSLRLEALRYDYGSDKISISGAAASVQDIDPSDTVVRGGITFHLN